MIVYLFSIVAILKNGRFHVSFTLSTLINIFIYAELYVICRVLRVAPFIVAGEKVVRGT